MRSQRHDAGNPNHGGETEPGYGEGASFIRSDAGATMRSRSANMRLLGGPYGNQ